MKTCIGCKYAEWKRTKAGRLHPSGDGECTFTIVIPVLPNSRFWLGVPEPYGGRIERKHQFAVHCPHYQPKEKL